MLIKHKEQQIKARYLILVLLLIMLWIFYAVSTFFFFFVMPLVTHFSLFLVLCTVVLGWVNFDICCLVFLA